MKVMVSEDGDSVWAQTLYEAQTGKRIRSAIYQIARKPQSIVSVVKPYVSKQLPKRRKAALKVANCVGGHALRRKKRAALPPRRLHIWVAHLLWASK
jgi:hypothetical protein